MSSHTEPQPERLPVVMRPNGKPYQPREVMTHGWDNDSNGGNDERGVVVLGTHDMERARRAAEAACGVFHGARYAVNPQVGWYRKGFQHGYPWWVDDEVRGAAGVMFTASDDPEEVSG